MHEASCVRAEHTQHKNDWNPNPFYLDKTMGLGAVTDPALTWISVLISDLKANGILLLSLSPVTAKVCFFSRLEAHPRASLNVVPYLAVVDEISVVMQRCIYMGREPHRVIVVGEAYRRLTGISFALSSQVSWRNLSARCREVHGSISAGCPS